MDYYSYMKKREKLWYKNGIGREILEDSYVKHCVVSTDYLAEAMKKKYPDKTVFVSYNKLGQEQMQLAEKTLAKKERIKVKDGKVRIGYFSGSKSHNKDFETVADVLLKILAENKHVMLMVVGYVDLDDSFVAFSQQIEHIPFVQVEKLPEFILRSDINIVPLEVNNPFCQAKSAIKYLEAAILEVPTVAVATGDFRRCIKNGTNGFVAENNEDWYAYLTKLINDGELRKKIGSQAKKDVLAHHTTRSSTKSDQLASFVQRQLSR
jgi:glycosyltransferase involved in cell wall biosynthesis